MEIVDDYKFGIKDGWDIFFGVGLEIRYEQFYYIFSSVWECFSKFVNFY